MTISLLHATQATGTDSGSGEIHKAQWNAEHSITLAANVVLGRLTSAGAAQEISEANLKTLQGFPISTTTNTIPKFNNTAGGIGTSTWTIDASNNMGGGAGFSCSGTGTFGVGAAAASYIVVNSLASGTAGGSSINVQNGGVTIAALGGKSAILGGAYSATPYLYGSATIESNVGMIFGGLIRCPSYTVAGLPAGAAGDHAWASNGRAMTGSSGTSNITVQTTAQASGCLVTKDATAWKLAGTNATVQA